MNFTFDLTVTLSLLLSISAMIFAWLRTRRQDLDKRLHEGSKRMDNLELRVQRIEQSIAAMPGKDDMHKLEITLAQMGGEMKAQSAVLEAMAESVRRTEGILNRHEDFLRETR